MKKMKFLFLALVLMFSIVIPCNTAMAAEAESMTDNFPTEIEKHIKTELYNLFPEKFKGRESLETMTLDDMQARAGTHTEVVYNGDTLTQNDVFLSAFKDAGWATTATGVIDFAKSHNYTISLAATYEWDADKKATVSVSYSTCTTVTHHIPAVIGKICSVGIFGDVTAKEYTLYIRDNYTNEVVSTSKGTYRYASGDYLDGIYDGQKVTKFYQQDYTINKAVDN